MSAHDPRYLDLLPGYALGALDGEELHELEEHLRAGCPECERALAGWRQDVERLAASAPAVEPSQTTRTRVLKRAEADLAPPSSPASGAGGLRLALAAALGGLLVGGWLYVDLRREVGELERSRVVSTARLEQLEAQLSSTRSELAGLRSIGGIAASPRTQLVALAGLVEPRQAFGQALVDAAGARAVFYAYSLRPTPAGKTYQLWYISEGTPVSAGIFEVDDDGRAMLVVEGIAPVESIDAWAVTVEPAGGSPQPTGTMVLKG